jgi:hypothetical protein
MPFRLAKLTACRKVRAMYRPYRAKSSRYGHESAMPQAFSLLARAILGRETGEPGKCHGYAASIPLVRMMRMASGDARNLTNTCPGLREAAGAKPAEYIT